MQTANPERSARSRARVRSSSAAREPRIARDTRREDRRQLTLPVLRHHAGLPRWATIISPPLAWRNPALVAATGSRSKVFFWHDLAVQTRANERQDSTLCVTSLSG